MAVRDAIEKSDLILVDDEQGHWNPFAAANLYQQGFAPLVAVPRQRLSRIEELNITEHKEELCRQVLQSRGVPADKIIFLGQDLKDDVDLGRALGEYAKSQNLKSVIVATTPAMSRLSRSDLRRGLGSQSLTLRMYPVRTRYFDEHNWWHVRQGWVTFFDAYYIWILHSLAR
ncbi:MAG TPA: hypothetical protein VFC63_03580 [Blastocatellia bacterium]|nr:hypothetical protein [Blastocatellia bacterium]